ncbi:MAG TPA: endonuclease/exonuclease/phosphatase family protein [Tepidisphaeraceae bacterium]|nr:endonuclease/exonuclease/phosphatase family protein [Tepidisphaeraceae bacterium]
MPHRLIGHNLLVMMLSAFAFPAGAQTTKPAESDAGVLRVLCFNIRYLNEKDGPDRWSARRDIFFEALTAGDPDLIGLQEVVHAQAEEIRANLSAYDFVGVGRDDGKHKGEYSPILFKRDRFEKLDEGHVWLSETPDVVGSKGWDANLPRLATWVKLADRRQGNRVFVFLNTHFDHLGHVARVESAKLLRDKLAELAPSLPVIITGDFNTTEDAEPYRTLVNPAGDDSLKLIDAYRAAHPRRSPDEATFGGFRGIRTGSRIDWILHTPHWQTRSAEIDRMNKAGRYPSDHYPVRAELKWIETK